MQSQKSKSSNNSLLSLTRLVFGIYLGFRILNLGFISTVSASDLSLIVSPPRIDLDGKPGDVLQKIVKVTNNSSSEILNLTASVSDFIVQDDLGTPIKVTQVKSGRYFASPWFTLENSQLTLKPKETAELVVLVTIPSDALPGGHYAGIFFEPTQGKGVTKTVSYTTAQVGSLFGITIAGDLKYDALIKDFQAQANLSEFGPIEFQATVENQSDTHIRPTGSIVIHDLIGRKLADIKLDELNIFPYTSRTLNGSWDTIWGLGRYTATLNLAYGPGLTATRSIYFWIMPYRLIAAILIVILVIMVIFIVVRRHMKHREDHRDDEIDELKRKIVELENRGR